MFLCVGILTLLFVVTVNSQSTGPVRSCADGPPLGFYYVADRTNRCVVWLCLKQHMIGNMPFNCPDGEGIPLGLDADTRNPCQPIPQCDGSIPPTPPPVTDLTTEQSSSVFTRIYEIIPGSHLIGGDKQDGIMDFYTCMFSCITADTCKGFDFDSRDSSCWFHTDSSVCSSPVPKPFCTHFKMTNCGPPLNQPLAELNQIQVNTHLNDGTQQMGVSDFPTCLIGCIASPTCQGFDFDIRDNSCWYHNQTSVCGMPQEKPYCTHYKLASCATTPSVFSTTETFTTTTTLLPTTTTVPTTTTTTTTTTAAPTTTSAIFPQFGMNMTGYHLANGDYQDNVTDVNTCITTCIFDPDCEGVDWDTRFHTCWFHTADSECNPPQRKNGCVHIRLTNICGVPFTNPTDTTTTAATTTAAPTVTTTTDAVVPVVTTTTAATTTTVGTTTTDSAVLAAPEGYVAAMVGYNSPGAIRRLVDATEQQCLDACLMTSFCLAVDYTFADRTCWIHGGLSYCNTLQPKDDTTHYQRVPCIDGYDNDVMEVNYKFHGLDGTPLCGGCARNECIALCFDDPTCRGVDYDTRDSSCYKHLANTVCDALRPKDYCTHYSRILCSLPTAPPTPPSGGPFPAPVGNFVSINFMGPSALPSQWTAYPGMHIVGGTLFGGPGLEGEACFSLCQADPTCVGVDFNSGDGTCWSHSTEDRKCQELTPYNEVYHAKKAPQCTFVTGTSDPYPTPIAMAP